MNPPTVISPVLYSVNPPPVVSPVLPPVEFNAVELLVTDWPLALKTLQ